MAAQVLGQRGGAGGRLERREKINEMTNPSTQQAAQPAAITELNSPGDGKSRTSLLLYFAGVGTGAALTLLFAPTSGANLRKEIGGKFKRSLDWFQNTAAEAGKTAANRSKALREGVEAAATAAKS